MALGLKKKKIPESISGIEDVTFDQQPPFAVVYNTSGDYSAIIKFSNPVQQYAADMDSYNSFHRLFQDIVKSIGQGYIIQKQDAISKKTYNPEDRITGEYLDDSYHRHFKGRTYRIISTHLIITGINKKTRLISTYDPEHYQNFLNTVVKIKERLTAYKSTLLNANLAASYIKQVKAFSFSRERVSIDNLVSKADYLLQGDKPIKSISLVDIEKIELPKELSPGVTVNISNTAMPVDLLEGIHQITEFEDILYNQIVHIPVQSLEKQGLEKKKKRHQSAPDPANNLAVKEIQALQDHLADSNELLVRCHFNIMIKSDIADVKSNSNKIETYFQSRNITPSKQAYNQLELFMAAIPGNAGSLKEYDQFLTTSGAALCLFFKETLPVTDETPKKIWFSDRQGMPLGIDVLEKPRNDGLIDNFNFFMIGPSGSGKSFAVNNTVQHLRGSYQADIIIVDTGHSYEHMCLYAGGKYITYSEEEPITMNPFKFERRELNVEKKNFLLTLITLTLKGDDQLNRSELTMIQKVINLYYEEIFEEGTLNHQDCCFDHFYHYSIRKIDQIRVEEQIQFDLDFYKFVLKKYTTGEEFGTILNKQTDESLYNEKFIVFEVDNIKEHKELFPLTIVIIMDVFLQKMRGKKGVFKQLIIEEAWKAIATPTMAEYLKYLYKTARKFEAGVGVVTQDIEDLVGNEIVQNAIIGSSHFIYILDQDGNPDAAAALLKLNEVEITKINTINRLDNKKNRAPFKEVFIKFKKAPGFVVGVEVSQEQAIMFSSHQRDKLSFKVYRVLINNSPKEASEAFLSDFGASGMKSYTEFKNTMAAVYKVYDGSMKTEGAGFRAMKQDYAQSSLHIVDFAKNIAKLNVDQVRHAIHAGQAATPFQYHLQSKGIAV